MSLRVSFEDIKVDDQVTVMSTVNDDGQYSWTSGHVSSRNKHRVTLVTAITVDYQLGIHMNTTVHDLPIKFDTVNHPFHMWFMLPDGRKYGK